MLKDQSSDFPDETFVFELDNQLSLRRNIEHGKEEYLRLLEYRIRRNPQDLLSHAQRIFQYLEPRFREHLLGALTDLYIALGEHGRAFRARMLATARPHLGDGDYQYFADFLKRGMHPCQARHARHSSLSAGYEVDNFTPGCGYSAQRESAPDPVQEAIRYVGEGRIERAQAVLSEELARNPMNAEAERELLELSRRQESKAAHKGRRLHGARGRLSGKWRMVKNSLGHGHSVVPPVFGGDK